MDWLEYEAEVLAELAHRYPDAPIKQNVMLQGRHSGVHRQIDVLIEPSILDSPMRIIVDAKHRTDPIDVQDVETFLSMMSDVGAHRGLIVSSSGYTKAALTRAHADPAHDLELDVLSLEDLKRLQGPLAIPYAGTSGVVLRAPFGWIVDAARRDGFVACLYQRGLEFESAVRSSEWMYVNFWRKDSAASTLEELMNGQDQNLQDAALEYLDGPTRRDSKQTVIRRAEVPGYPAPEYTGYVEFDQFIFFVVLFSPLPTTKRNLRKLREVLRTVIPVHVDQQGLRKGSDAVEGDG